MFRYMTDKVQLWGTKQAFSRNYHFRLYKNPVMRFYLSIEGRAVASLESDKKEVALEEVYNHSNIVPKPLEQKISNI